MCLCVCSCEFVCGGVLLYDEYEEREARAGD